MHVCPECGERYAGPGRCTLDGAIAEPTDDPLLGTDLGRFRLARVLGVGGMGRVYLGVQRAIGGRVAIKVLTSHSSEAVERFFAEARAVNLIRHENIVDIIDLAHLPDGRPFIVMELVEGQTLRARIAAGDTPIVEIARLMGEVLGALAAAHAIQIVHRDLKPDNVVVTARGQVKVLDFGIAKLVAGRHGEVPRTATGQALGTPEYMAPEQIMGGALDARTDLYSAGVLLFELVTSRRPFEAATDFDLMRAHLDEPAPSARTFRPDLSPVLDDVIQRALAKSPDHRFQNAAAMATALAFAAGQPAGRLETLQVRATVAERPGARDARDARDARAEAATEPRRSDPPSTPRPEPRPAPRAGPPRHSPTRTRRRRWWSIAGVSAATVAGGLIAIAIAARSDRAPGVAPSLTIPIASSPPPPSAVDYDPQHFDPIAYLPRAQAFARTHLPDGELLQFNLGWVDASGIADVTRSHANSYVFQSPASSGRDPSAPCRIAVAILANGAQLLGGGPNIACDAPIGQQPRCSIAQARRKAMIETVPVSMIWTAAIGGSSATWMFDVKGQTFTTEDDCGL